MIWLEIKCVSQNKWRLGFSSCEMKKRKLDFQFISSREHAFIFGLNIRSFTFLKTKNLNHEQNIHTMNVRSLCKLFKNFKTYMNERLYKMINYQFV